MLANKTKWDAASPIFLVESKNIVVKVKDPYRLNKIASAIMEGVDNVALLPPFSSNMRIQNIKGTFYVS